MLSDDGACQFACALDGSSVSNLRSAAIHCQANAGDLLPTLTSLSLPEIVSGLHRKPGFGRSAHCLLKSCRHVRANGGLAMDNPRDRGTRHPELLGNRSHTNPAIVAQHRIGKNLARVGRVKHSARYQFLNGSPHNQRGSHRHFQRRTSASNFRLLTLTSVLLTGLLAGANPNRAGSYPIPSSPRLGENSRVFGFRYRGIPHKYPR
jgi:hypothetical protein